MELLTRLCVSMVFLVSSSASAGSWPSTTIWPDVGGGGFSSGSDIDPANILFAEDTGDGINNITAFGGDDLVLTVTGVGTVDLVSANDINLTPGGNAGEDVIVTLGNGSLIVNPTGAVSPALLFTLLPGSLDVWSVTLGSGGFLDMTLPTASATTQGYVWDRDNANTAGVAHSVYEQADTEVARINHKGNFVVVPQTQTIADSGDASPATATIIPSSRTFQITCSDANSCDVTVEELNVDDGTVVTFICMSASPNTCDFADTAGKIELAAGAACSAGQFDTLTITYASDRWVEISRSDNSGGGGC